jgi:hypothetical protein
MGLYLDKTQHADWASLVEGVPDKEFMNVTRSSLPLLAFWMGANQDASLDYHFEFTVPSVPRARPSHTDLMIIGDEEVIAIEGKSTEPRYETVTEWSAKPGGLRSSALAHWVSHIEAATGTASNSLDVDNCVYQMVHRLASVCSIERPSRALTYQVFDVGIEHDHYRADLERLSTAFVLAGVVELRLETIGTTLTPEGQQLKAILPSLDTLERARSVRQALLGGPLFKFGAKNTEVIK